MRLQAGARLGPYEIVAPLGAGGMGEVYQARDTRLGRDVAIKILSTDLSASPEARQRFEREARTISQLSHPHICALYDVGESPNPQSPIPNPYLVMELLDGETLAQRLVSGALPPHVTLRCAIQIADALDKAHGAGIVHRDLKPANIMLTKSGVKLLDFGLAKPVTPSGLSLAATAPPPITARGAIAGTVQDMAPEQLAGRPADARSDIYAFGAVTYEMATGRAAFGSSIAALAPAALDRLVRTCMAADPAERWQSAHDVRLQLQAIVEAAQDSPEPATASGTWLPWVISGIATLMAAAAWLMLARGISAPAVSSGAPAVVRFTIPPPEGGAFSDTVETACIALSPDGSQLAYVAADAAGVRRVWIRALSAVEARPIAGTDGSRTVIWSPDGRSIAFFAGDKLKRIELPDGAPVTVGDVPDVRLAATWGDGQILFTIVPGGIYRVSASGGSPVLEHAYDRAHGEVGAHWPWFLPGGKRYLYLSNRGNGVGYIMVADLGQAPREVIPAVSTVQYVDPGYLVFARDGTLLGQPFDASTGRTIGDPFPVAEPVRYFFSTGGATFATSRSGVLVYQSHPERGRLVWFDRSGKELGVISDSLSLGRARLSPDGSQVLFDRATPNLGSFDLMRYDIGRGVEQRITTDRLSEASGVWLSGGLVMFAGGSPPRLFRQNLATGAQEEVLPPPSFSLSEDVSPDGRTFVFAQRTVRGNFDLWTLPLDSGGPPSPLRETPFDEMSARFSRDGRHLAFAADESGRYEIYVMPFPRGEKVQVSAGGGNVPRWSRDGRELFYISGDRHLVSVAVRTAPSLTFGAPQRLFAVPAGQKWDDAKTFDSWPDFDVSLDGTKFLAVVPQPANRQPLTVVLNWLQAVPHK